TTEGEVGAGPTNTGPSSVVLGPSSVAGFAVGAYDRSRPLVIDPILLYSTFLGGSLADEGLGVAVDAAGSAYVTGRTSSANFPIQNAAQPGFGGGTATLPFDVFVAKLNPAGNRLLYSTYLGGGADDEGLAIAVDAGGNAYVTGLTTSSSFPVQNAFQSALQSDSDP